MVELGHCMKDADMVEAVTSLKQQIKTEIDNTLIQSNLNRLYNTETTSIFSKLCYKIVRWTFNVYGDDQVKAQKLRAKIFEMLFPENEKKALLNQNGDSSNESIN